MVVSTRLHLIPKTTAAIQFHFRAFMLYGVTTWILVGLRSPIRLSHEVVGQGPDPSLFVWFLAWWPTHWWHPWKTTLLWAPTGIHLGWVTTVPFLSLIASPLTMFAGPIVSYNLMMWLGVFATAWATYLFCYEWHHRPQVGMVQGLIVAISPYLMGQAWDGHLNLVWMPVPLLTAVFVVRYWRQHISTISLIGLFTSGLILQFFISTEVLATSTVVLACAMLLTALVPGARSDALRVVAAIAAAYLLSLILLSPWLYHMFQYPAPVLHVAPVSYSISPINWVVPTTLTIGGQWFQPLSTRFPGNLGEASGYLGLPWITVLILVARGQNIRRTWLAPGFALLVILMVAALGPRLHWYGLTSVWLPESLLAHLPFLRFALPSRLMFYAEVLATLLLSPVLTHHHWTRARRLGITTVVLVSLLPNFMVNPGWVQGIRVPSFYRPSVASKILPRHSIVLIWPYNTAGQSMIWQAESGFAFRMAGGYVAPADPPPYDTWPFVAQMASLKWQYGPYWQQNLALFLSTNRVNRVLTPARPPQKVKKLLTAIGLKSVTRSGVEVWAGHVSTSHDSTLEASAISTLSLLHMLVRSAALYVQQHHALSELDPRHLEQYGDLPGYFGYFASRASKYLIEPAAFIAPAPGRHVVIGTLASKPQVPLLTPYLSQLGSVKSAPLAKTKKTKGSYLVRIRVTIPLSRLFTLLSRR